MSGALYFCCNERRRAAIDGRPELNGIDFLEVYDDPAEPLADRQRTLFVHFINDPGALSLGEHNVMVRGGERAEYKDPQVRFAGITVDGRSGSAQKVLVVEVDRAGDFSTYTLSLVPSSPADTSLDNFDEVLRSVDFSFKAACESKFDCGIEPECAKPPRKDPAIDYLARDFRSLRQVMLDRMSVLMPGWEDRTPADLGVALVELLAYVGDYLSYRQDAVATEAYLDTARRRVSVRRHARLVDYLMHNGSNARAWLQVQVSNSVPIPARTPVLTRTPGIAGTLVEPDSPDFDNAISSGALVFATMHDLRALPAMNELHFYTWGARECCLPKGATKATLEGHLPEELPLEQGVFLLFEEVVDPRRGNAADADPAHRHVVRLTAIERTTDRIGGLFQENPELAAVDVTNIAWAPEDALPFPLCISSEQDQSAGGAYLPAVSVARGNVVLADHGRRIRGEKLGTVPESKLRRMPARIKPEAESKRRRAEPETIPARCRPALREIDVTHAAEFDPRAPAYTATHPDRGTIKPDAVLHSTRTGQDVKWSPATDLLGSDAIDPAFVAEVENDGRTLIRFGDGTNGMRPVAGEAFTADYRVGNGVAGNVGAESLRHMAFTDSAVTAVTNPLPASGGMDAETIESVRNSAPFAFRTQKRAVTLNDYAFEAARHPSVQKAAATLRWTGSWYTTFLSADRYLGASVDAGFEDTLTHFLEPVRLAGHDLEIESPRFVPLELTAVVDVLPGYSQSEVRAALAELFSSRGLFHPDRFTFAQPVYLSPLYAAAQKVAGVDRVNITVFQRQDAPGDKGIQDGKLAMGRLEIARLDNDPNFPGRGSATLDVRGGR